MFNQYKMRRIKSFAFAAAALTPFIAAAQVTDIQSFFQLALELINAVLPVFLALASIIFIWGVVTYITAAGDEEKRKKGQQRIMYGLIGLFVLVAFWGIVNVVVNTLGLSTTPPTPPEILQ